MKLIGGVINERNYSFHIPSYTRDLLGLPCFEAQESFYLSYKFQLASAALFTGK
jgi:hypothetical protein